MPIAILGGIIVDKWVIVVAPSLRHRLATAIILISLACNYGYSLQRAAMIRYHGSGYNTTVVWEGDEVQKIEELSQQGYLVFSDDPLRLNYALSYPEWLKVGGLPGRPRYRQTGVDDGFAEFQENIAARGGVIVMGSKTSVGRCGSRIGTRSLAVGKLSICNLCGGPGKIG